MAYIDRYVCDRGSRHENVSMCIDVRFESFNNKQERLRNLEGKALRDRAD